MIWCRYRAEGQDTFGLVEGEEVVEVSGTPFGEYRTSTRRHRLQDIKLLVPVIPGTFYCAGVNYAEHVIKMARKRGAEPNIPKRAEIGYRANSALIAHEENIVKPADSTDQFQYEGELVAVIGKEARNISRENALDYVLGWTIGNDVSERSWQRSDRTFWRSKNADTFKPMGPWIVTGLDPNQMRTTVRLNGEVTDEFDTGNMVFDVPTFISEVTKYITLHPGDVMWMGTDGAPQNMKPGDTVEVEISGIGVLRNRVVGEPT